VGAAPKQQFLFGRMELEYLHSDLGEGGPGLHLPLGQAGWTPALEPGRPGKTQLYPN
jgi:hypothetical protein